MLEATFFAAAALLVYHYALYPALVIALARLVRARPATPLAAPPRVSLVIAAYNEERVIAAKLRNTLELDRRTR